MGAFDDPRIGGHDAVNIGPDPNFIGVGTVTDNSCRVVRAAAAQGGDHAVNRSPHIAGNNRGNTRVYKLLQPWLNLLARSREQRLRIAEIVVGDYQLAG